MNKPNTNNKKDQPNKKDADLVKQNVKPKRYVRKPFVWDYDAPLARMRATEETRGETLKAFLALQEFYAMGPGRERKDLFARFMERARKDAKKPPTISYKTLLSWSVNYKWQDRIERQVDLDMVEFQARLRERQLEMILADYEHSGKLRELVDEALEEGMKFTKEKIEIVEDEDGNKVIVKTEKLDGNLIARLALLASDLGRRGVGLDVTKVAVEHSWQDEAKKLGIDPDELVEQLTERAVEVIEAEIVSDEDSDDDDT